MLTRRRFLWLSGTGLLAATELGCGTGSPRDRTLKDAIRGPVLTRDSPGFKAAAGVYNARFDHVNPRAVARPVDANDVAAALRWAGATDTRVAARSGGHGYAGYSSVQDGLVLDLRGINSIKANPAAGTATVGPGARLIDMYAALARYGVTIPAGSCPSVGVAGSALGGGMGFAGRSFGLTCDQLVAVKIATADGRLHNVDRRTDPDLLWALRGGGGGNFGIVTELTMRVHEIPRAASWFSVTWPWSRASDAIDAWQRWAPHAPDQLTSVMALDTRGSGPAIGVSGQYLGPVGDVRDRLAPILELPGAQLSSGQEDYLRLQFRWAGCRDQTEAWCHVEGTDPGARLPRASFYAKSDYVARPIPVAGRERLVSEMNARSSQPGSAAFLFDAYGGAINRVAPADTAFVHRDQLFSIQYLDYGRNPDWINSAHAAMRPYVSGQAYQNYIDPDLPHWQRAYYGVNYSRLAAIRRRIDPDHRFMFPQAIGG